jgi:hypothetical protein
VSPELNGAPLVAIIVKELVIMRKRLRSVLAGIAATAIAVATVGSAAAQSTTAYTTKFVTSITYQNVGTGQAGIRFQFYSQNSGTPVTYPSASAEPLKLNQNASVSLAVGSVSDIGTTFKGGAVLSSDQPVVATMVQVPTNSNVRNRPLSNGFSPDAGAGDFLIPTVLKNAFNTTTQFSVQNVDTATADITVRFVNADPAAGTVGEVKHTVTINDLPAGSVSYVDAGTINELGGTFNGSATLTAVRDGTSTAGKVVATALELETNNIGASAFEGVIGGAAGGANKLYMPTAMCNAFQGNTSAYAVQNVAPTGGANAAVTVTYRARPANDANAALETFTDSANIAPGAKASFSGCAKLPAGYTGSAVVESTGAKVVGIAKIVGAGITTAAPGATAGASRLALPYVRWTSSFYTSPDAQGFLRQLTTLAIQNVSGAAVPANSITVTYLDKNGQPVGNVHTIGTELADGGKVNSRPIDAGQAAAEFGAYGDGTFGGGAVVNCSAPNCQLVVVARVQSSNGALTAGEDYNGIPIAP